MKIASSLALKWLGGIAAVGGAGGGVLALQKSGYLSWGGKGDQNKEALNNQTDPKTIAQGNKADEASTNEKHGDKVVEEDEGLGFPKGCEDAGGCELDQEKIKKIKFKDLEEGNGQVTVTGLKNGQTFTSLIQGDEGKKKYIFDNASGPTITISKGNAKVNIPEGKKIKFINENNKLKKLEEGKYGLPEDCQENTTCYLTQNDLEDIKFSDFTDVVDTFSTISVDGLDNKKSVSLTIKEGKYIFNSPSSVSIKHTGSSGTSTTIILNEGETEFKVDQEKLKKLELWEFGLPEDCKVEDGSDETKNCTLSSRDLKKIKFKDMDTIISISGLNNGEKVNLEIKKANDSSFLDGRKYIFTPKGSSDVIISGTKTITLSKGVENTFKKVRDQQYLVEVPKRTTPTEDVKALDSKINELGLPSACTFANKASGSEKSIECELTHEELKKVKFSIGEISSTTGGWGENALGDPKTYKLKIEESNESQFGSQNIRITFLNEGVDHWSNNLVISGTESNVITIADQSNTEFKINDQKQLELAWKESSLSDMVGLKCPKDAEESDNSCTLKNDDGSIKVLISGEEKEFKPSSKADIESNMTYETSQAGFNQGIKIELIAEITGTNGAGEDAITLEKTSYEIKRISEQNWRFTKMIMGQ